MNNSDTSSGSHATEALVLSCMDFRMVEHVAKFLDGLGLTGKYDTVSLAGAAIGVMYEGKPAWGEAFWDHVGLAQQLHGIRKVIVIDHRDCGACKAFVGPDCADDWDRELEIHAEWLRKFAKEMETRAPELELGLYLMALDGSVDEVTA